MLHLKSRMALWGIGLLSAMLMLPVTGHASLLVAKTMAGPPSLAAGEETAFSVVVSNDFDFDLTGVKFTDVMPKEGTKQVRLLGATAECRTDGSKGGNVGTYTTLPGNEFSVNGAVIPAIKNGVAGKCTYTLTVTANEKFIGALNIIGKGQVSADPAPGGSDRIVNEIAGIQSVDFTDSIAPKVEKWFSESSIANGQTSQLSIKLTNPSKNRALVVTSLTDRLPAGMTVVSPLSASVSCSPSTTSNLGAAGITAGGNTIVIGTGTIAAGSACTVTVGVRANVNLSKGKYTSELTNTIGPADLISNSHLPSNQTQATLTVTTPLVLSKNFEPSVVVADVPAKLTIGFHNKGTEPLDIGKFTDLIDGGVAPKSAANMDITKVEPAPGSTCSFSGLSGDKNQLSFDSTKIPANTQCSLVVTYTPKLASAAADGREFTNVIANDAVSAKRPNGDVIPTEGVSSKVTIRNTYTVEKHATTQKVAQGSLIQYSVTVTGWRTQASTVTIKDVLESRLSLYSAGDFAPVVSGTACTLSRQSPHATSGEVAFDVAVPANTGGHGAACTVTFWAQVAQDADLSKGKIQNKISDGAVCDGALCAGNGSGNTEVEVVSPLHLSKAFSASEKFEGDAVKLTITLENISDKALTEVALTDIMPLRDGTGSALQFAQPVMSSNTCGGELKFEPGSRPTVKLTGASVPGRAKVGGVGDANVGRCEISLQVLGEIGKYTNTIPKGQVSAKAHTSTGGAFVVNAAQDATADVAYIAVLTGAKSFAPEMVAEGGRSTVRIRLDNGKKSDLTGVAVTDALPQGMRVATPSNAYSTCGGTPGIQAVEGASTVSMTEARIAASGHCALVFDVETTGSGPWINTIQKGDATADGHIKNSTAFSAQLNGPKTGGDLGVTIQHGDANLSAPGEVTSLTVEITNRGQDALTGISLESLFRTDGLLSGALTGERIAPIPNAHTTCNGGVVTANPNGSSFALTGATLQPNASCKLTFDVTLDRSTTAAVSILKGSIHTDQGISNATDATTTVATGTALGLAKHFAPAVISAGQTSRLKITVFNSLIYPVTDVQVRDTFPQGLSLASTPNTVNTCAGNIRSSSNGSGPVTLELTGGTLAAGSKDMPATCFIEVDVTVTQVGEFLNTIAKGGASGLSSGSTIETQADTKGTLTVREPIAVQKAFMGLTQDKKVIGSVISKDGVAKEVAGKPFELTIVLKNPNAIQVTGITLRDVLPEGLTLAKEPSMSSNCPAGLTVRAMPFGRDVLLSNGVLQAGASCAVTVQVLGNDAGSYVNEIRRNAITSAEGISNAEPTTAKVVITTPPSISKEFDPPVIAAKGRSKLTIRIHNPNAEEMTLSQDFVDTLPTVPGPVKVVALDAALTTCQGPITAVADAGTVTLPAGRKVPAGGCSIVVDVTAESVGVHTNVIAAGALATNMGANPDPATATLSVSSKGFISGRVFIDHDQNGQFTAGDAAIAGSLISLYQGTSCGGTLVQFTNGEANPQKTNAAGNYLFSELDAGAYSICQGPQPAGTLNAIPVAGSAGGNSSNALSGPFTSQIAGVQLTTQSNGAVSSATGNNFPEVKPGSISGTVFVDLNNNGVRDANETGLLGIKVELVGEDFLGNPVKKEVRTDNNGDYRFSDLPPGTYTVIEPEQPPATVNGITTAGSLGGTATPVETVPSKISDIKLPSAGISTGNNFAELPLNGTISGRVFLDYNDNGIPEAGDTGLANILIRLEGVDVHNNPITPIEWRTDSSGNFVFMDLPAGTFKLTQVDGQPVGTLSGITKEGSVGGTPTNKTEAKSTISGIVLGDKRISVDNYFAEIPAPDLVIGKTHQPQQFMAAGQGQYTIVVGNIGLGKTVGKITVVDTLPAGITATDTPTGSGWSCAVVGQVITCESNQVIPEKTDLAARFTEITIAVSVDGGLGERTLVNVAVVSGGGEPEELNGNNRAEDPTPISRSLAKLSGAVWLDHNHERRLDSGAEMQANWTVELLRNGAVVASTKTGSNGRYAFTDIVPDRGYDVQFRHPETGVIFGRAVPNESALGFKDGVVDPQANPAGASTQSGSLTGLTLEAGSDIQEQSLPLDPGGVIYDAVTRAPVKGTQVVLKGPPGFDASHVVGGSLEQVTGSDGWYQFTMMPNAPAGEYRFAVTPPAGYIPGESQLIPACQTALNVAPSSYPATVQDQATAPSTSSEVHSPVGCTSASSGLPAGHKTTQHYLSFTVSNGSANLVNNHLPLDPVLAGAIVMTKVTPKVNVTRGELVPYTMTARNTLSSALHAIAIEDQIPPGFQYVKGSAQVEGIALEPEVQGRLLRWPSRSFNPQQTVTVKLLLVVGSGVGFNEYVNQTWSRNVSANEVISNIATAAVRVVADPTFDCSDLIGTVYDDKNRNGYQDEGEPGIAGVRLATAKGWLVTTDEYGRYHIACADVPNEMRGSNFIIKVDERSMPSGYRIVTENPRVVRMTQGRLTKANFGASIHRVVRLDLTAEAFTASNELTPAYLPQLDDVLLALQAEPSILRIAYQQPFGADAETSRKRVAFVRDWLKAHWEPVECCYDLQLEEEIIPVTEAVEVVR